MDKDLRYSSIVAATGAVVVVARLALARPQSFLDVLWAEDGFFALCVRNHGALQCMLQPHEAYYHLVPRLSALAVSSLPLQVWPVASVLAAASMTGLLSGAVFHLMRGRGYSIRVSSIAGLVLVMSPLFGLEVVGVTASIYVPLIVCATVLVVLNSPKPLSYHFSTAYLLVVALTMPAAGCLVLVLLARTLRRDLSPRVSVEWGMALLTGTAAQFIVALNSPTDRGLSVTISALRTWADSTISSSLSILPGLSWAGTEYTSLFPVRPPWFGPWLVLGLVICWACWVLIGSLRPTPRVTPSSFRAALLILSGLALSLIPMLAGSPNFRYFVAPFALWSIAALVLLAPRVDAVSGRVLAFGLAALALMWWTSFPASDVRVSPAPSWSEELSRVTAQCRTGEAPAYGVVFTPLWPNNLARSDLPTPVIPCSILGSPDASAD